MPAQMFSIYHALDLKGAFKTNPANPDARGKEGDNLYRGPVEFPKMFYHPEGREKIVQPRSGKPDGVFYTEEQREIITTVAENAAQEKELRASGWHDHPAKAMKARAERLGDTSFVMPPVSPATVISEKDAEIARLKAELAEALAAQRQAPPEPLVVETEPKPEPSAPKPKVRLPPAHTETSPSAA